MDARYGQQSSSTGASAHGGVVFGAFACIASVLVIAMAVVGQDSAGAQAASVIAPALWVIGALALALGGRSDRGFAGLAAFACYSVAFFLPAVVGPSSNIGGHLAFFLGWIVVPIAWLANLAFVIALALEGEGRSDAAALVAFLGLACILTVAGMPWNGSSPGLGFWLWAAASGVLGLGCAFEATASEVRQPSGRPVS